MSDDTDERLARVETRVDGIYDEIKYIKKQVNNDLPHQIAAAHTGLESQMTTLQSSVDTLNQRRTEQDAVTKFITRTVHILVAALGVLWTLKQIWPHFLGR